MHLKEKRTPGTWKPRFIPNKGKGKSKFHPGYFATEEGEYWEHEGYYGDLGETAYGAWDAQSQSLGGYEDDTMAGFYGADTYANEYEYVDLDDPYLQVFAAMVADGLDENLDGEGADYAADVIQTEAEACFMRQQAHQKGHGGFSGKRFELKGELSLEERRARVSALKSKTSCRKCGQKGHWAGDAACPKGGGKGKKSSAASSTSTASSPKGKAASRGKSGSYKPRTVYFAVKEEDGPGDTAYLAYRSVPPPTSLDPENPPAAPAERRSLEGVAPATLSSLLSWPGPQMPSAHPTTRPSPAPTAASSSSASTSTWVVSSEAPSRPPAERSVAIVQEGRPWDEKLAQSCLQCKKVIERRQLEQPSKESRAATAAQSGDPHGEPHPLCQHLRVSHVGTNRHVWKRTCKDCGLRREGRQQPQTAAAMGYGAIGASAWEGPDTEAVKVLEMAGTVVMVQESGGMSVPLDRLPGIVENCVKVYRQRHCCGHGQGSAGLSRLNGADFTSPNREDRTATSSSGMWESRMRRSYTPASTRASPSSTSTRTSLTTRSGSSVKAAIFKPKLFRTSTVTFGPRSPRNIDNDRSGQMDQWL